MTFDDLPGNLKYEFKRETGLYRVSPAYANSLEFKESVRQVMLDKLLLQLADSEGLLTDGGWRDLMTKIVLLKEVRF